MNDSQPATTAESLFSPPRQKLNIFWWLGGVFLILLLLFFYQLFGPSPRIIVSPQTKYITEPLGPDGLPDYEAYVLDLYRDGVTPENNAAALLWQALGPGEVDSTDFTTIAAELDLLETPSSDPTLQPVYKSENRKKVAAWMHQAGRLRFTDRIPSQKAVNQVVEMTQWPMDAEATQLLEVVEQVIDHALSRPWTSKQIPPMADWVAANQQPLDMLVAASARPRFYSPSPEWLNGERDMLITASLQQMQSIRDAGRALPVRAMWHLGEGRPAKAWQDIHALHLLTKLLAQSPTLVEQLVAFAINGIACDATVTLLHHGNTTLEEARQMQRDLEAIPNFSSMADSLDKMERCSYIDTVLACRSEGLAVLDMEGALPSAVNAISVDWNIALRKANEYFDRIVAAARMPARAKRELKFSQISSDLYQTEQEWMKPISVAAAALSLASRSEAVAAILLSQLLPAFGAALNAQDRSNNALQLTRLAAALAVYRAEHDEYPEKFEILVPDVLNALPVDIYNAKPFIYRRTSDGYLLYTVGENGVDDGGSHHDWNIFEGRTLSDLDASTGTKMTRQIPTGADDISIRVPRPAFKLPTVTRGE